MQFLGAMVDGQPARRVKKDGGQVHIGRIKPSWLVWPALLCALVLIWHFSKTPGHDGAWLEMQARLPEVRFVEDVYQIRNIRDFSYHDDGSIRTVRYLHQDYPLASLTRIWLGLSHFTDYGLAHSFLSFEFDDGRHLVASVEARMRPGQSYAPVAGLLRRFHKIIVLGSEPDIIGLRSHVRKERVLLYPLELSAAQNRRVFAGMMQDVRTLEDKPSFYNTLLDNCTTSLLRHDPEHRFWRGLLDYRILLPGFADEYALARGWIRADEGLAVLRSRVVVPDDLEPGDARFSERIRGEGQALAKSVGAD